MCNIARMEGKPSEVNGLVSCTFSHVSLDLGPTYESLSYTSSDRICSAQLNEEILLNRHMVATTRNPQATLRKLLRQCMETATIYNLAVVYCYVCWKLSADDPIHHKN